MAYVYMVVRKEDGHECAGSPLYIGITEHRSRLSNFERSGLKYDKSQLVVLYSDIPMEEAEAIEIELIAHYGRRFNNTGILRNLAEGGRVSRGYTHTDEARSKMSKAQTGKKQGAAQVEKKSQSMSRLWCVKFPDGRLKFIRNMNTFCKEHGLRNSCMSEVANENHHRKTHQGFMCWKEN